jgi:hypothetical protein
MLLPTSRGVPCSGSCGRSSTKRRVGARHRLRDSYGVSILAASGWMGNRVHNKSDQDRMDRLEAARVSALWRNSTDTEGHH